MMDLLKLTLLLGGRKARQPQPWDDWQTEAMTVSI